MLAIPWLWKTILLATFCYLLRQLQWMNKRKRLPPGPKGLPFLGNLLQLGKNPHHDLFHLSQKHGPIMYMRFGHFPTIVVSSPEAAEKFLKTHDRSFASRPYHEASSIVAYGQRNLIFAPYGPYWRNMRKLCTSELLSSNKISSFQSMRRAELDLLINSITQAALDRVPVDLTASVYSLNLNMSCLMIFGEKYSMNGISDRDFRELIRELMHIGAVPNLGDFFPFLGQLELLGITRRYKHFRKTFDAFIEKIIDDHVQSQQQKETKDFVDTMMAILQSGEAGFEFDRRHVKSVLLDMMLASMDSSATAIDWAMAELLRHPNVFRKLQKEIDEKVGMNRTVDESDLKGLDYLDMVVKESMRLHPVAPLLLPHEAVEDCLIDGYNIRSKSLIIINVWAIGRDPNVWKDPESFFPERYVGKNIDLKGRDFELIPFGSGTRICAGLQLGLTVVRLVLAQLVHCFDWELPNNMLPSEVDMNEVFGLSTSRAKHLVAVPTLRLIAAE